MRQYYKTSIFDSSRFLFRSIEGPSLSPDQIPWVYDQLGDLQESIGTDIHQIENSFLREKLKGQESLHGRADLIFCLQVVLQKLDFDCGQIDGIYAASAQAEGWRKAVNKAEYVRKNGSNTQKAVLEFQKAHGLTQDGMAGKNTLAALVGALEKKHSDKEITNTKQEKTKTLRSTLTRAELEKEFQIGYYEKGNAIHQVLVFDTQEKKALPILDSHQKTIGTIQPTARLWVSFHRSVAGESFHQYAVDTDKNLYRYDYRRKSYIPQTELETEKGKLILEKQD
ncbi:peptidoglycan-binding protein [Candidatus Gracilibacteria bacterium]|nr:peptidoglycan-binding protein [Candidatus Gracilibacteria bacterium]MCF7819006.1 peptidoglycan-binding protein [Candidatus Gracilibacteria bacterium]